MNLLAERWERIRRAVALEQPDRTPVVLEYAGFAAGVTNTPAAEFLSSQTKSVDVMLRAFDCAGEADGIDYGSYYAYGLSTLWMSKVMVPGVDLPADAACQVLETGLMQADDYSRIVSDGWTEFSREFLRERVWNDVPPDRLPAAQPFLDVGSIWAEHGVPVLSSGCISPPFELLCGARSLASFFVDLMTIPDQVQQAMDAIVPHLAAPVCAQAKAQHCPAVWVGGWRSAGSMISPRLWNRFVWPYLERIVREVTEAGLIALLHLDSNWTRDLPFFRSLPERKCILSTDGKTDLFRAKELLGDRMCLMGDVPASMLTFGSQRQVTEYCAKLIGRLGPAGFILHSGCDIPVDAKLENVRAMVASTGVS